MLEGQGVKEKVLRCELITVNERFRTDTGDLTELKDSIAQCGGLVQPIVVDQNWELVAGYRRLMAYKELGLETIPVRIVATSDSKLLEAHENLYRKNFTPSEAVAVEEYFRSEEYARSLRAREEAIETANATGAEPVAPVEPVDPPKAGVVAARAKAAKATNFSPRTLSKVHDILEAAKANPELAPLVEEMNRTRKVDGIWQRVCGEKAPEPAEETAAAESKPAESEPATATVPANSAPDEFPVIVDATAEENWVRDGKYVDAQKAYLRLKDGDRVKFFAWIRVRPESRKKKSPQWDVGPACEEFLLAWNATPGVKRVSVINDKRRSMLRERWKEEHFRANWRAALSKIPGIPGLLGHNNRKWIANIIWFLRPDSVTRLMEGYYDHWRGTDVEIKEAEKKQVEDAWLKAEAAPAWKKEG